MIALSAAKVNPELIDSVIIGNVLSCSSVDAPYISRHVSLRCGIPIPTPALTGKAYIFLTNQSIAHQQTFSIVNRLCGSGFQSLVNGAHVIQLPLYKKFLRLLLKFISYIRIS